jgi:hypothetical protein
VICLIRKSSKIGYLHFRNRSTNIQAVGEWYDRKRPNKDETGILETSVRMDTCCKCNTYLNEVRTVFFFLFVEAFACKNTWREFYRLINILHSWATLMNFKYFLMEL